MKADSGIIWSPGEEGGQVGHHEALESGRAKARLCRKSGLERLEKPKAKEKRTETPKAPESGPEISKSLSHCALLLP